MTRLRTFFAALLALASIAFAAPALAQQTNFTRNSAGELFSVDTVSANFVAVQLTGTWAGTVAFEGSNDNVTWNALTAIRGDGGSASSTTSNSLFTLPATHKWVRGRISTYTSGTVTGSAVVGRGGLPPYATVTAAGVSGPAAHSAAASGSPVQVGCVVRTAVDLTLVAGDINALTCGSGFGVVTSPYAPNDLLWQNATATGGITTTTDFAMKAEAGASIRNYVASCTFANSAATATEVVIKDGATVMWRGYLGASAPMVNVVFNTPLKGTANTAINVAAITTAAAVHASCQGYTGF